MALYTGRVELESGALNLRSAPGGGVIGAAHNGEEVQVLDDLGEWVQIVCAVGTGYVSKRYVRFVKAPQEEMKIVVRDGEGKALLNGARFELAIASGELD